MRQANFIWVGIFWAWYADMNKNATYLTHWTLAVVTTWFVFSTIIMIYTPPGKVRCMRTAKCFIITYSPLNE